VRTTIAARTVPLALVAGAIAAALSCADPSPVGVGVPAFEAVVKSADAALVPCVQTYDSVTQVIGPAGGVIAVGSHFLWVDTMALADTVSITAVAPADTLRWVRFQPDGLQFQTNGAGRSAILFTTYKDCGVPTSDTLRIAQVTDSLGVLGYLETYVQVRRRSWSQGNQYVYGVLHHFSQYALAW
jgi:hypothetical protein